MGVRFAASTHYYSRALSLGSQANFTVACWAYMTVDRAAFSTMLAFDSGSQAYAIQASTGRTIEVWNDATSTTIVTGPTLAVGSWYFVAIAANGTGGHLYWRHISATTLSSSAISGSSATFNLANIEIGNSSRYSEWWNGEILGPRLWLRTLGAAELLAESRRLRPESTANLAGAWDLLRTDPTDSTGQARNLSGGVGATTTANTPILPRRPVPRIVLALPAGGGQSAALGQASSTSTAQALAKAKARATGQATAVSTAQPLTRAKTRTLSQAVDASTAQPLARTKLRTASQAAGSSTAIALGRVKSRGAGQSAEADTTAALGRVKVRGVGQPVELATGTAVGPSKSGGIGQALTADTATALGRRKAWTLEPAVETDAAGGLSHGGGVTLGQAQELGTAAAVTPSKARALLAASSDDTAHPLQRRKARLLGLASGLDGASAVTAGHADGLAQAVELDAAFALAAAKARNLAPAAESDTASEMGGTAPAPAVTVLAVTEHRHASTVGVSYPDRVTVTAAHTNVLATAT